MKLHNKIKIISLVILPFFSFSNDENVTSAALKKLEHVSNSYIKNVEKYENFKNNEVTILTKAKYGIISGKEAAAKNIATIFDYYSTSTYQIFTKINYTTTIKLNADEEVTYIGSGDTENWDLDQAKGGADGATLIFIKPLFENLNTNLSIITNKRTYYIYLVSDKKAYNPLVQWQYPYEANMSFKNYKNNQMINKSVQLETSNINDLNFEYSYDKSSSLAPLQVYNDKRKTVIVMPKDIQEMPIVYSYGLDGNLNQVNYRVIGQNIIVDKVLSKIQLILGTSKLEIKSN